MEEVRHQNKVHLKEYMYNLFLTLGGILGGRPNYGGPNGQGPNGGGKELDQVHFKKYMYS